MPGILPSKASSRNFIRDIPYFRIYPRERPVKLQRLFTRVGLASRGNFCNSTHLPSSLSLRLFSSYFSSFCFFFFFFSILVFFYLIFYYFCILFCYLIVLIFSAFFSSVLFLFLLLDNQSSFAIMCYCCMI